jgi:hypothetical protein
LSAGDGCGELRLPDLMPIFLSSSHIGFENCEVPDSPQKNLEYMNAEQLKQLEKALWAAADNLRANSDLKSSEYATPEVCRQ